MAGPSSQNTESAVDPEAALDELVAAGVVDEEADGSLTTTDAFEDTRRIYHDSYVDASDERFHDTVAELFGLDRDDAATHVERHGVTREELVAYLSLRSFLETPPGQETLAVMAALVAEVGPGTPVPDGLEVLDEESWRDFLTATPDAVVTVWAHGCAPCEAMKADIESILDTLPEGVAVAGIDGETCFDFRLEYEVNAAPAFVCFRDGEHRLTETGRKRPEAAAELFASVYET
ncbi:thioredoxin family protein [Halobium salinum]|uniref:Thioredoxin family protein n=1 Tax=Halobium salinum TaxID=1364940 RepID=A0ABD5PDN3_9EURY|nr:thioredoxin family protein [Halobium salinum]